MPPLRDIFKLSDLCDITAKWNVWNLAWNLIQISKKKLFVEKKGNSIMDCVLDNVKDLLLILLAVIMTL